MSCSVVAIPISLLYTVISMAVAGAGISAGLEAKFAKNLSSDNSEYLPEQDLDGYAFSTSSIFEKTFETPFMDKEILLKTMEEHGIEDINETGNVISGKIESFVLQFEKPDENSPYSLKILCNQKDNAEEKFSDIASEYSMNVQEASYLSIVEKLKENNLQIEEETVEDDNTIVLTVNLE